MTLLGPDNTARALRRMQRQIDDLKKRTGDTMVIADATYLFPVTSADNPACPWDQPVTLVAVSVDTTRIPERTSIWLYDMDSVPDPETDTAKWVIPGPGFLGAVPFAPMRFETGLAFCVQTQAGDETDVVFGLAVELG
jgi:hypothetical protein